jgi:hypothetical protein
MRIFMTRTLQVILRPAIVLTTTLILSSPSWAGLGVGVLGGLQKDTWSVSGTGLSSVDASKNTSRLGALLWLPILPTLSVRTGYLMENQSTTVNSGGTTYSYTNSVIPINLQFELPLTGLYAFGGLLMVTNQSVDPSTTSKNNNDTRTNLGVGYDMLGLPLMSLAAELEYQMGSNVNPTAGYSSKLTAIGINLVFKVGF